MALHAMEWLFRSGHAADLALVVLAVEAVVLARRGALRRAGPVLLAGAGFALALRAALVGAPWWMVALPLAGAGAAHALDLARLIRRSA